MSLQNQNPHDKFAHKIFSNLTLASEFLSEYLPAHFSQQIDFTTLRLANTKFVSSAYREHRTDFLFEAKTKNGEPLFVTVMQEHKSYPQKDTLLQMTRDMLVLGQKSFVGFEKTGRVLSEKWIVN